jgi:hypothetical protein
MKSLELENSKLIELNKHDAILISGGDVDGLMRSKNPPSWDNFTTNVGYVAGLVVGAWKSLF